MKNKQRRFRLFGLVGSIVGGLVCTLVLVAGIAQAQDGAVVRFSAGNSGGSVSGESFTLNSVIGQSIGGSVQNSGSAARLCSGFQCGQVVAAQTTPVPDDPTPVPDDPTPVPDDPTPVPDDPTPVPDDPTPVPDDPTPVPDDPTPVPDDPTPEPQSEDIVINEVYYLGDDTEPDWIELRNTGDSTIDISQWWFCSRFSYKSLSEMTTVAGASDPAADLVLEPGEVVSLAAWTDLDGSAADLALFTNDPSAATGQPDFGSPANMVDFIQWGSSDPIGRTTVAVEKGIWTETAAGVFDFVPTAAAGQSVALTDASGGTAATDFSNGDRSQGEANPPAGQTTDSSIFVPFVTQ